MRGAEQTPQSDFSLLPTAAASTESAPVVWWVVAVVLVVLALFGGLALWLRWRKRRANPPHPWLSPEGITQWRNLAATPLSDDPTPWIGGTNTRARHSRSSPGSGPFASAESHDPTLGKPIPLSVSAFSATLPSSPLAMRLFTRADRTSRRALQTPLDALDTSITRMRCPECRRTFEAGALFCPFDGHACNREQITTTELSGLLTRAKVCPECKTTYGPDAISCTRDEARLVVQVPDTRQGYVSVRAVVICARCQLEQALDETTCARCQQPLSAAQVLTGRITAGHPPRGIGPKTRICTGCGVLYADGLSFCARDGARLVTLN